MGAAFQKPLDHLDQMSNAQKNGHFLGEYRHTIDDKNRVTVPVSWRGVEGCETLYMVPHPSKTCIMVMPLDEYNRKGDEVAASPALSAAQKKSFERLYYSQVKEVSIDKQGRLLVSDAQRQVVGMETDVVLVGGRFRFDIWGSEKWDAVHKKDDVAYEEVGDVIGF